MNHQKLGHIHNSVMSPRPTIWELYCAKFPIAPFSSFFDNALFLLIKVIDSVFTEKVFPLCFYVTFCLSISSATSCLLKFHMRKVLGDASGVTQLLQLMVSVGNRQYKQCLTTTPEQAVEMRTCIHAPSARNVFTIQRWKISKQILCSHKKLGRLERGEVGENDVLPISK